MNSKWKTSGLNPVFISFFLYISFYTQISASLCLSNGVSRCVVSLDVEENEYPNSLTWHFVSFTRIEWWYKSLNTQSSNLKFNQDLRTGFSFSNRYRNCYPTVRIVKKCFLWAKNISLQRKTMKVCVQIVCAAIYSALEQFWSNKSVLVEHPCLIFKIEKSF